MLLLDRYLPQPDVRILRRLTLDTDPETTWQAMRRIDFARLADVSAWRVRALSLPAARRMLPPPAAPAGTLDELARIGWRVLDEAPGTEVVFGAIGMPWRGGDPPVEIEPHEFARADLDGRCRVACNLVVRAHAGGHAVLTYEARLQADDPEARRRGRRAWRLARPACLHAMDAALRGIEADGRSRTRPERGARVSPERAATAGR